MASVGLQEIPEVVDSVVEHSANAVNQEGTSLLPIKEDAKSTACSIYCLCCSVYSRLQCPVLQKKSKETC